MNGVDARNVNSLDVVPYVRNYVSYSKPITRFLTTSNIDHISNRVPVVYQKIWGWSYVSDKPQSVRFFYLLLLTSACVEINGKPLKVPVVQNITNMQYKLSLITTSRRGHATNYINVTLQI